MKKIIISVSALFLVFCMLAAFFLLSSSGLQFGIQWVASLTENKIRIDNTTGRLIGPMMFEGVYIHSPQNSLFINKLTVNWRPMGLLQNQLHILELIVEGIEYTMKQQSLDDPDAREPQLPNSALVIPFIVDKAVFTDIGILSFTGEKKAFIEQISSSLSGGKEGISIDDLSVQAPGYRIDSQMHLQLSEAWSIRSQGAWHVVRTGCSEMGGAFAVSGPLDDLQISLSTHEPGTIDIQGSLSWAAGEVNWSVDGSGQDMVLPDICPDWPDLTNNMVFHTEGNIDDYRITLDAKISPPDMPLLSVELDVKGNSDGLVIAESPVTFDESRSLLTGQIQWGEIVYWSAIISTESLDFSPYQDVVAGDANFELDITGTIDESTLMYEAHISQLRLSVDEFSEEVTGAIRLHGDLQGAEIVEARITTGKEMVELSGQLGWTDGLAWDVLMQLEGIDPATWSNLPQGGLSAAIASSGRVDGEEIELQASMTSLSGELAGYSVTGGGEIDYYPGQLEIRDFFLITGRNRMEVHGTAGDNIDVTLMVDGQDLSQIFEPLAGQLEIAASVAGTKEKPVVTFSAGAVDIAYLDYALNTLNANGSIDKEGGLDVRLAVEHLSKDNSTIEALNLSILGSFENHTIIASVLSDFGDLTSSLTGQLLDDRSWEGSIDDLDYVHQDYGRWQQEKQSRVAVSPDRISLDDICIASSGQRMCAGASWSSAGSWHAELSELQLEISKLKDWDIIDVELAGDVLGNVVLDGVGSVVNNGAGAVTVSKLYAPLPENDVKGELELIDTQLTFSLHDQILKAALRSSSGDGSTIDMGLTIRQFGELSLPMSELPLEGSVRADIVDVTLLKQLSGDMLVPSGQLSSDVTISGTFQRPFFEGKVSLVGGEILFPDLGLLLSDIALVLDGDKNGLTIDLLAHSGDGQVTGTGVVFLNGHDWRVELSIRGDNLQVLEQREMRVSISPDLDVRADSSGVTLTGRIEIPRARIEPEKMIASDSTSRDTVFIDDIGSRDGIPYQFDVAVILGDDVMVEGYGFSGFFVGNLDISGAADREIRGVGEIQVSDGFFSVRERVLDISRGRLLFDGGHVDNPELDIQARKTIKSVSPGTTDVIVGVNITGTAQDYFIELFSAPPMNDRDILSYIALGRPFRQGDDSTEGILNSVVMLLGINRGNRLLDSFRGRGLFDRVSLDKDSETRDVSLVVDRRLSDRVTIGYDFNLFDNAGQFRFHYNLREGFSLEVRNSVDSSGVELLYSVER